jgi:hypothetical protein
MNPEKLIASAIVAVGAVGAFVGAKQFINITKTENAKREQIRIETDKQIAAIRRAGSIVEAKIKNGDYDSNILNVIPQLRTDHDFYTMAERFDG